MISRRRVRASLHARFFPFTHTVRAMQEQGASRPRESTGSSTPNARPSGGDGGSSRPGRGKRAYHEHGAYLGSCERPGVGRGPIRRRRRRTRSPLGPPTRSSAPHRRRPAAGSTACTGSGPRGRRSVGSSTAEVDRLLGPGAARWGDAPAAVDGFRSRRVDVAPGEWMSLPATIRRESIDRRSGGCEPSTDLFASAGRRGGARTGRAPPWLRFSRPVRRGRHWRSLG